MPNELTSAIRAAELAFQHASACWPHHSEGVKVLALDALRIVAGPSRLCFWTRAIEAAERTGDRQQRDDLATIFAPLAACVNPAMVFGGAVSPTCWTARDFPQRLAAALAACKWLAERKRKSAAEIAAELEKRRHTRFPGVRALAREYGINQGDMSKIIGRSAALRGWKARHTTPRAPRVEGRDVADLADTIDKQSRDDTDYTDSRP